MTERSRDPHLLFILSGSEGYGVRRVWEVLTRGQIARGRRVTLALLEPEGELGAVLAAMGAEVVAPRHGLRPLTATRGARKLLALAGRGLRQIRLAVVLSRMVRERGVTRIIVQSPLDVTLASLAARLAGVPAYWMMPNAVSSGYPFDLNRRVYRFLFRHMNLTPLANSRYSDASLGPGNFARRVVHLGVDPDRFAPSPDDALTRAELGVPDSAILLGLFARLTPEKGQMALIEALALLGDAGRDIHLLICGGDLDSAYGRDLTRRAAALGLADRAHFLGLRSPIVPCYAPCDVILNTRVDPEPFGLSVVEGMAMEKPVLAHRAGGPGETVLDDETGWLIDDPSPAGVAIGLRRMLADRARWPEMGKAARARVLDQFTDAKMLARLEAVIAPEPASGAVPPRERV